MSSVIFDAAVGGNGSTVTDDANPTTGLASGGFRTRLVPMFAQIIAVANWVKTKASEAAASALSSYESATIALNAPGTSATSTTSVAIATGSKTITLAQTDKLFALGQTVSIAYTTTPTNRMIGEITAFNSGTGAMTVNVTRIDGSGTFAAWTVSLCGPAGLAGANGTLVRRFATTTSTATITPNCGTQDIYTVTALAVNTTLAAPTGTPTEGQGLLIRIKDNGTSRTIAYNVIYRAAPELPMPSATLAGKTMYLGFIYNATDSKWDLTAVLNNV